MVISRRFNSKPQIAPFRPRGTRIRIIAAGQSGRSALISWGARQRRPTENVKMFVLHSRPMSQPALAQFNQPAPDGPGGWSEPELPMNAGMVAWPSALMPLL